MKVKWLITHILKVNFYLTLSLIATTKVTVGSAEQQWWKGVLVYQIYPRSFMDSDGDGIGDLNGITGKLEHIRESGASALWLSPIYKSPQVDFGYDISNFTDVDPTFGNLDDFRNLLKRAKSLGLRVLLDLVPNHSSDQHEWFRKSVNRLKPYDDYYVWSDGKIVNGTRLPPNNWLSVFGGPAWHWNEIRGQYYYHQFDKAMPDLNYRNPKLRLEMESVLTFWLDQGVDGFRIDAAIHLFEDEMLRDEPLSNRPGLYPDEYGYLEHIYTHDLDEIYVVMREWRQLMDDYSRRHKVPLKYAIVEAGTDMEHLLRYFKSGVESFNFALIDLPKGTKPSVYVSRINQWLDKMPGQNWVTGNHDVSRVGSRFKGRADQMSMIALLLPGISVIYNGDEIGMLDRPMSYKETVDPSGCNAGPERYQVYSRDPARTPFQWDNTTSAGFSTSPKTWLPVNENYRELNLLRQLESEESHFNVFKRLSRLKKTILVQDGYTEVSNNKDDTVLGIVRRLPHRVTLALLINMSDLPVVLNLRIWMHLPEQMRIYTTSVGSGLRIDDTIRTEFFVLPAAASVVLTGNDIFD